MSSALTAPPPSEQQEPPGPTTRTSSAVPQQQRAAGPLATPPARPGTVGALGLVRLLLVAGVALLVAAVALPGVRAQVLASLTRVDQPYTVLSLAGGSVRSAVCAPLAAGRPLSFQVQAGAGAERTASWRVTVSRGTGAGPAVRSREGSTRIAPAADGGLGTPVVQRARLRVPAAVLDDRHTVRVELVGTEQVLVAHCGGRR